MPDASYYERKADKGKARWDLLPWGPLRALVEVLTYGASKYADWSWMDVPDAKERYEAAFFRHWYAFKSGETYDSESGILHLAHALCNLWFLFVLEYTETPAVTLPAQGKAPTPGYVVSANSGAVQNGVPFEGRKHRVFCVLTIGECDGFGVYRNGDIVSPCFACNPVEYERLRKMRYE